MSTRMISSWWTLEKRVPSHEPLGSESKGKRKK